MKIITKEQLNELLIAEEKSKRDWMSYEGTIEQDGLLYTHWLDERMNVHYLVRTARKVHMGFNDSPIEKIEEVRRIVESERMCEASWGVTGRTMHSILAHQLAEKLPEYQFQIGYNYECKITKRV